LFGGADGDTLRSGDRGDILSSGGFIYTSPLDRATRAVTDNPFALLVTVTDEDFFRCGHCWHRFSVSGML
jgi:hypothetical protein